MSSLNNNNTGPGRPPTFAASEIVTGGGPQQQQQQQSEEASWMMVEPSSEVSSWTHRRELREQNKQLRAIYEESGLNYGADVGPGAELAKRREKAADLRSANIDAVMRQMMAAKSLDLCFLVDITGSMEPHMDAVHDQIRTIVDFLLSPAATTTAGNGNGSRAQRSMHSHTPSSIVQKIRLAFVGYRDFGDDKQFEVLDFTESVDAFHAFCVAVKTGGGGDDATEDVFGGLEKVIGLDWSRDGSTRILFHIADCPCHGSEYHNYPRFSTYDSHLWGDPTTDNRPSLPEMLKQLAENGVKYYFGRITKHTDRMVAKFTEAMTAGGGVPLVVCDLKDATLLMDTIVSSTSIAVAGVGPSQNAQRTIIPTWSLDPEVPNWNVVPKLQGVLLSYEIPASIGAIVSGVALKAKQPTKATIQCAPRPFGAGSERIAYYGLDVTRQWMDIVLKRYTREKGFINAPVIYELAIQVQTIAAYLASMFCQSIMEKVDECFAIRFLKGQVFSYKDPSNGETVYMTSERRYPADYVYLRFSNNADYAMLEQTAKTKGVPMEFIQQLMAFSHWTYQASGGYLMVVDLQGILNPAEQSIELTDPAIHCTDKNRFGRTNLGARGMKSFFQRHVCNRFCRAMDLKAATASVLLY